MFVSKADILKFDHVIDHRSHQTGQIHDQFHYRQQLAQFISSCLISCYFHSLLESVLFIAAPYPGNERARTPWTSTRLTKEVQGVVLTLSLLMYLPY